MYYVGIDWADQKHDVSLVDDGGRLVNKPFTIRNTNSGYEQLHAQLERLSENPLDFKIGIETPQHLLVDFLLELGYAVWAIFPGAMKSFRKRYRTSGARDDVFDAFVLADVLRTDKACWRSVDLGSERLREIRLLANVHHDAIALHTMLNNALRATLKAYYPAALHFFGDVACANALAFLQSYPTLEAARRLTREQLAAFFKEQRLRNGKTVRKIEALLQQQHVPVATARTRVYQHKALCYAKQLAALAPELKAYAVRLQELIEPHPDGALFLSYPGVSYVTAARLVALFGENRARYAHAGELQGLAGTCPVTEKTGTASRIIYYRRACNKFYRDTMHNLAFSSLTKAAWINAYYRKQRAHGKTHSHALRCLANVHLRILFAMWKNRTPYDENIFLSQKTRHLLANQKI